MEKNKYVDFLSDEDFLKCVQWVCDAYPKEKRKQDMKKLQKNTLDPFKLYFDAINKEKSVNEWLVMESSRQYDKTVNNRVGEFHQMVLGKVIGWEDLGRGDKTGLDLKKSDSSIFIELKNKENTVNSSSMAKVYDKLEKALEDYPNAIMYWGFVFSMKGDSGEKVWKYLGKENSKIKMVWGKKLYELITGDKNALDKLFEALPKAILDISESHKNLTQKDLKQMVDIFKESFKN
ncbi:Eco47II family restriction endonuclease [archaeon]|jgi:hypothetical protein|nr:Eco47II family restriction endonuclease [archaeon]